MRHFVISLAVVAATAGGAGAAVLPTSFIDFEVLPDGATTPTEGTLAQPLRYEFNTDVGLNAVEFRALDLDGGESLLGMAQVGAQPVGDLGPFPFGFFADEGLEFADTPSPDNAFDEFFLTTELQTVSVLEIVYDTAIKGLNFDLGDVDGAQRSAPGRVEVFTVQFLDHDDNVLSTSTVRGDDEGAGDRSVVNVSFESAEANIKSILVTGTTVGGVRKIGIAFDNFDPDTPTPPSVVPLPGTLPLAAVGLGAMAFFRRRKRKAA